LVAVLVSHYIARRRRIVVVKPMTKREHGGSGWLALLGLVAAVVVLAANWDGDAPQETKRTLVIHADSNNACYTQVTIGGHAFRVLLDSGAAVAGLVFGSNHAAALGFSPRALSYSQAYSSANGEGREAPVLLHDVRLNGWQLGDVPAVITRAAQDEGLFGAELLHQLEFRTTKGFCVLTMPEAS
jgi:clan AA aspartic protease (TIGR02281 family)